MGLGLYTYQAAKLLVPLISLLLIIQTRKFTKSYFVTLFILAIPAIYGLVFGSDSNRLKVMSLFSYHRPQTEINQIIAESNPLDYRLFIPTPFSFSETFLPAILTTSPPVSLFLKVTGKLLGTRLHI